MMTPFAYTAPIAEPVASSDPAWMVAVAAAVVVATLVTLVAVWLQSRKGKAVIETVAEAAPVVEAAAEVTAFWDESVRRWRHPVTYRFVKAPVAA